MASQDYGKSGGYGGGIAVGGGVELQEGSSSVSSSEGSQTLQGDSPTEVRSSNTISPTSPISSPADGDLSAITNSRFWKLGAHFVPNADPDREQASPLAARDPARFTRHRNGFGNGPGSGPNPFAGAGGFRSSRTWVSPDALHNQEFVIIRNSMRRLFKNSEVAKWKLQDYTAHREAMIASKQAALQKALAQKELELALKISEADIKKMNSLRIQLPANNFRMQGNLSRVLGMKTIWCQDWENGKDEIAPWPSPAEMKWEGDDRAKTACGRFLPLPREPGAPGIQWGQLQVIEQYPLDQVQCIPTMEDIYLPVDEISDDEALEANLITTELLDAIDESL